MYRYEYSMTLSINEGSVKELRKEKVERYRRKELEGGTREGRLGRIKNEETTN